MILAPALTLLSARKAGGSAPVNTVAPAIDITSPHIGDTLSVSTGIWTGSPSAYTYQWKLNGSDIPGETNSSYVVQAGDFGLTLTCVVTAFNAVGATSVESAATNSVQDALPAAPVNTIAPALSISSSSVGGTVGVPYDGDNMSVDQGTWDNSPTDFIYSWKYVGGGTPFGASSAPGISLQPNDVGHQIYCTVKASNAGGFSEADSDASGGVSEPPSGDPEP